MELEQLQIKKKILDYLKIDDTFYLENDYPIFFATFKRASIKNNRSFEEQIIRYYEGYRIAVHIYDVVMMLEAEYNINITESEVALESINGLCELICNKIKNSEKLLMNLEEHKQIHESFKEMIENDK